MCDKCANLFENSHLRAITRHADEKTPLTSLTDAINNLQTEIKKILIKPALTAPTFNRWPLINEPNRPAKRLREIVPIGRIPLECQSGSKQHNLNVVSVPICEKPASKFWLYLSRIRTDVTNEAIAEMVKANLELETDPDAVKLVSKGADVSNMSFISFKVGLDPSLQKKALDPSTWPEGVLFRQFEDLAAPKFRKPSTSTPIPSPIALSPALATN